jgi:hypothetical protein
VAPRLVLNFDFDHSPSTTHLYHSFIPPLHCYYLYLSTMNALKAEIMTKRKAIEPSTDAPPNKYMRKGDLARLQQEREQREAEEAAAAAAASAIATAKANELQVPTPSISKVSS